MSTYASTLDFGDVVLWLDVDLGIHVLVHIREADVDVIPVPACSVRRTGQDSIMGLVRFGDCDNGKKWGRLESWVIVWRHRQGIAHWGRTVCSLLS